MLNYPIIQPVPLPVLSGWQLFYCSIYTADLSRSHRERNGFLKVWFSVIFKRSKFTMCAGFHHPPSQQYRSQRDGIDPVLAEVTDCGVFEERELTPAHLTSPNASTPLAPAAADTWGGQLQTAFPSKGV